MSHWIEGEPKTDGLYAAVLGEWYGYVISRHEGANYFLWEGKRSSQQCSRPIMRHYPLPPPPPPLKLPRRFRAKFSGKPVVGCERSGEDSYRLFIDLGEGGWCFVGEAWLTELVWEEEC